jgi:hypothetical protein
VAEDIVSDLRNCGCIVFGGAPVAGTHHGCLRQRAADEIERLRADGEWLLRVLRLDDWCCQPCAIAFYDEQGVPPHITDLILAAATPQEASDGAR